jgi:uncharacterized protein (DUF2345 family)
MTMIYLTSAVTLDNVAYPAPCLLNIDRMSAASVVAAGQGLYATTAIMANAGAAPSYDHERSIDGRHVSGRTGAGPTETPAQCFAAPQNTSIVLLAGTTVDGIAYAAGQAVTMHASTAKDLIAGGTASSAPASVTAAAAAARGIVDHRALLKTTRR